MAVLAALPLIPKSSQPSSTPLKRRSALRSSRNSVRSSTSTVRLVDPYHQPKARQYSVDSMLEIYDKSPPIPFASRQKDQDAGDHRRATEGFGLPTAPTTRWSSLVYGSSKVENHKKGDEGEYKGNLTDYWRWSQFVEIPIVMHIHTYLDYLSRRPEYILFLRFS